ncbi:MAG: hypothetical protein ACLGRW_04025 [Acidobacteriota bacterium]
MRKMHVFHSTLAPEEAAAVLSRSVEKEQMDPDGKARISLRLEAGRNAFKILRRRSGRSDFPCQFYGRIDQAPDGTRIEGYFDFPEWTIWFLRVWLGLLVLIALAICLGTLNYAVKQHDFLNISIWAGLLIPLVLVLWGLMVPKIARLLSRGDERYILQFVQDTFAARTEEARDKQPI